MGKYKAISNLVCKSWPCLEGLCYLRSALAFQELDSFILFLFLVKFELYFENISNIDKSCKKGVFGCLHILFPLHVCILSS